MHPNLLRFAEQFEQEAVRKGSYRHKLGRAELLFLELVWGPAFQYQYDGLRAEYPFKDFKGGQRFADFVYMKQGMKLLIEVDGFSTHARDISPGEFDDHLSRQNDLVLSGWLVLRFSARQVEKRPQICQRQLKQALGHWWSLSQGQLALEEHTLWELRRNSVIQMAIRGGGTVRPAEVAKRFGISNRAAANWMKRFTEEGYFSPAAGDRRISIYKLVHYVEE